MRAQAGGNHDRGGERELREMRLIDSTRRGDGYNDDG